MDVENKADSGGGKDSRSAITVESYLDAGDKDKVQRKLQQRHVQMCVALFFFISWPAHPGTRKGLP